MAAQKLGDCLLHEARSGDVPLNGQDLHPPDDIGVDVNEELPLLRDTPLVPCIDQDDPPPVMIGPYRDRVMSTS